MERKGNKKKNAEIEWWIGSLFFFPPPSSQELNRSFLGGLAGLRNNTRGIDIKDTSEDSESRKFFFDIKAIISKGGG